MRFHLRGAGSQQALPQGVEAPDLGTPFTLPCLAPDEIQVWVGAEGVGLALSEGGRVLGLHLPGLLPPFLGCWGRVPWPEGGRHGPSRDSGATQELVMRERGTPPLPRGPPAYMTSWLGTSQLCLTP